MRGDLIRCVGVGTDRDDLAAEFMISSHDICARIGLSEPGAEAICVEFDPLFIFDQVCQDPVKNISVCCVGLLFVFRWTIADHIVEMTIHIKIRKGSHTFQNSLEIFVVRLVRAATLKKSRVVRVFSAAQM